MGVGWFSFFLEKESHIPGHHRLRNTFCSPLVQTTSTIVMLSVGRYGRHTCAPLHSSSGMLCVGLKWKWLMCQAISCQTYHKSVMDAFTLGQASGKALGDHSPHCHQWWAHRRKQTQEPSPKMNPWSTPPDCHVTSDYMTTTCSDLLVPWPGFVLYLL